MREKLEKIVAAYGELEAKMGDPAVVSNQSEYNKLAKDYANQGELARAAKEYLGLMDDLAAAKEMLGDADMKEFAQEEIASIEARMPQLEEDIKFMLIPSDPADEKDIIVEIRAGAGGDEAAIFAGDLYNMYTRFASDQGWKCETMDMHASEAGGFKEISFKMLGDRVYSIMKFESGVHRVQRVPKTESQGRIIPLRQLLRCFQKPTKSRSRSIRTTYASMCIVRAAQVVSASTRPTQQCASRICLPVWSFNRRIRSRSCRTRSPR